MIAMRDTPETWVGPAGLPGVVPARAMQRNPVYEGLDALQLA